ncbi:cyclin-like protein [Auriculariales sp. MPI-PUGE-AT-0066]|nr:cyclin-like protein [Auriculariales sp. MPI-PUGE-AT-0066]
MEAAINWPEPARHGLYEASSQYRNWRFSDAQLADLRERTSRAVMETTCAAFERDVPGSSASLEFPTPQEELALVRFYAAKIGQICSVFRFGEEVEATGVVYLKRFYMKHTVMTHHPKNVMLTALFLAAKTCNRPVSIADFVKGIPKTTEDDVLSLEFPVAQSLNFEFAVWHAHRALWGIFLDAQTLDPPPASDELQAAYNIAIAIVRKSRLTDVDALYTPAQIAYAAWHRASSELATLWLTAKEKRGVEVDATAVALIAILQHIDEYGDPPSVERVRDIDRRLKLCRNPETIPGSRAYLRRQAEHEALIAAKRKRKAEKARAEMEEDEDPFGGGGGGAIGANREVTMRA